jgi:hypothetical protein
VARLMQLFGSLDAERYLEMGKRDAFAERAKVT